MAIEKNRIEIAKLIISHGVELNARLNDKGQSALHYSASLNRKEIIQALLSKGAYVFIQDNYGRTPLHCAALEGSTEAAKILISYGANVNTQDDYGRTPLHCAWKINMALIFVLTSHGASIKAKDKYGFTPIDIIMEMNGLFKLLFLLWKYAPWYLKLFIISIIMILWQKWK